MNQNNNKFKKKDIPGIKKSKHNQLSLLFEINEYINETDDIKVILKGILTIIKNYFNYDTLLLYLWNSEINKIVLETSTEKKMSLEYNPEEGLAGTIFHIKQSINSINIFNHSQYQNIFKNGEEKVCYFGIPVLLKAECIGVLEIWNKKGNSISHYQQKTIQIICSRLAGLLEVSKILERFKTPKRIDLTATFYGIPISNGISIGRAYIIPELLRNEYLKIDHSFKINIENEKNRLTEGFANAIQELIILIKNLRENRSISESEIKIFQAHLMILQDESFLNSIKENIEKKKLKAEICLSEYIEEISQKFKKIDDPYFKDRAYDFIDIGQRIIMIMQSRYADNSLSLSIPENSIIIAEYINPSFLVSLDKTKINGIAIEKGGRTSHLAILAQSLKIPAVSELKNINHIIPQDSTVLLDGNRGTVIMNPNKMTVINYQNEIEKEEYIKNIFEQKNRINKNQHPINIRANISFMTDIKWAHHYNMKSVGLYRSEFFCMQFNSWPNTTDQIAIYKELADSFNDEVTIRLFDIGADKKLPYLKYISEDNPLLGLRSVRFLLQNLDILNTQLSAILSLHEKHPNIQILIPMVTTIEEIVSVKTLLYKLKEKAKLKNTPKLGIMIEVPSILFQIEGISDHIDFFSIGTNDLIQYMYAADRESGIASTLYSSFHPSIIYVLSRLNDELVKTGKNVTVCGELSGNPAGALYLTALGYRSLSINPSKMPIINYMCSFLTDELLIEIKKTILKLKDIKSIKDFLKQSLINFDSIFSEVV